MRTLRIILLLLSFPANARVVSYTEMAVTWDRSLTQIAERRQLKGSEPTTVKYLATLWFYNLRCRGKTSDIPDADRMLPFAIGAAGLNNHLDDATLEMIGFLDTQAGTDPPLSLKSDLCVFVKDTAIANAN